MKLSHFLVLREQRRTRLPVTTPYVSTTRRPSTRYLPAITMPIASE